MTAVTRTDRLLLVCNSCEIEVVDDVFVLSIGC